MKNRVVSKGIVLGIIFLFVGVGIQPAFAADQKEYFDIEYNDVNLELCGLDKEYTVKLTEQQLMEIDVLFESIKDDLDNVKTQEETVRIYNDAIAKLDRYGLFSDCSITQVQNLIIGKYLKSSNNHVLHKLYKNKMSSDENVFCLICGHTDNTLFIPMISMLLFRLCPIIKSEELQIAAFMGGIFRFVLSELLLGYYRFNNPFALGSGIMLGSGWVETLGLFGLKSWAGTLYGQIYVFSTVKEQYCGATGFTGIKILKRPYASSEYPDYYYLGFANHVHIGTEKP